MSELADEVVACAERTLGEHSARMAYSLDLSSLPLLSRLGTSGRRRGGLLLRLVKVVGQRVWSRFTRRTGGGLVADGIIEPSARRWMVDYGHHAMLGMEGRRWSGPSGRSIADLGLFDEDSLTVLDPVWLLDLARGANDATVHGVENVRGWPCRRLDVHVDLGQASAATETGLRPPSADRFEELLALPVSVWIDGERVRRVRFTQGGPVTSSGTVELWDFGVDTSDLDWTRLPTSRTPDR